MEKPENDLPLINHLRKLYAEYEKLQLECVRLRKKFTTNQIKLKVDPLTGDKPEDELRRDLERERLVNKSLNADNERLLQDISAMAARYAELLAIFNAHKETGKDDVRIKQLEEEIKELKEMLDFANAEKDVLKDIEEQTFRERLDWVEEKKKYEEVVVWSKHLNDRLKNCQMKSEIYERQIASCNKLLDSLLESQFNLNKETSNVIKNNDEEFNVDQKIHLLEQLIKSKAVNDENSNVLSQQSNSDAAEVHKKKLAEMCRENGALKESNRCLASEVAELKKFLNKNNNLTTNEIDLKLENVKLTEMVKHKEEMLEKLMEKYTRNRAVLEDNYKRSTEEIKQLDNFISMIIAKLNSLPAELKSAPALAQLIEMVNLTDAISEPDIVACKP